MERHASSAELKARAKAQLLGKYGTLIPALLAVWAVVALISMVVTVPFGVSSMLGIILQFIVDIFVQLFMGIFLAGQTYLYLNVSCGGNIRVSDVFYGFTHHPDKAILIQLFQLLLMLAWFVPCFICLGVWMFVDSVYMLIPISITFCIGLAGGVLVTLRYSQSFYVMLDFPDFTARQCLRYSREIMKGNMGRKFYLDVSFIPMYLLGIFTCCIGLFFVVPYINAACSNFYLELMEYRNRHQA